MEVATLRAVALSLVTLSAVAPIAAQGHGKSPRAADDIVTNATPLQRPCADHELVCVDAPLAFAHIPELAAAARTSSDHVMLAAYFSSYASNYRAMADRYAARAAMDRGHPNRRGADPAIHWDRLAAHARAAAAEAQAAASVHERLAALE